jgi:hypothetical protein
MKQHKSLSPRFTATGALVDGAIGEWTLAILDWDANRSCANGSRQRPSHCPGTSCGVLGSHLAPVRACEKR